VKLEAMPQFENILDQSIVRLVIIVTIIAFVLASCSSASLMPVTIDAEVKYKSDDSLKITFLTGKVGGEESCQGVFNGVAIYRECTKGLVYHYTKFDQQIVVVSLENEINRLGMFRTVADSSVYDRTTGNVLTVHFKETHYNPSGHIYTLQVRVSLKYEGGVYEDDFKVVSHSTLGERLSASANSAKILVTSKLVRKVLESLDKLMSSERVTNQDNNTKAQ